ncbi:hypothetical protein [Geodermatophilus obscurus]|uniref:Uncharacterized protein n=1 Tax=Geodermatophilus obscurus (strain ATCC 25078 / DSM 43160 / JCM 3152 / CCUG 61914 / KCC A-0152 / KCTC 9177 / NBRC 13315 / NRRL B-3577 / G-20) TaxID=526225 RepID=D2SC69_GEOOG|nr:hypothetical protein [Geodermatophilus obscurus]ADB74237.1 hypothetical protein Gobs_1509 [Geodermatophilus obscurus DSM 43160]
MSAPLVELSALLGVEVDEVVSEFVVRGGRYGGVHPNSWRLHLAREDRWTPTVHSERFRSIYWLNTHTAWWGRPSALPDLTKRDGRTALRLMHEHLERTTP